jgi:surface protein
MFDMCTKLTTADVSNWDTGSSTNFYGMFYNCVNLRNLNVENFKFTNCKTVQLMLANIPSNIKLNNKITPVLKSAASMFGAFAGTSLDLTGFDLSNSTNNDSFISAGQNLTDFKPPSNITTSIMIRAPKISVDSLLAIMDNLVPSAKHTQVLDIGATNIAKLTEEQLTVALSKNWSVC